MLRSDVDRVVVAFAILFELRLKPPKWRRNPDNLGLRKVLMHQNKIVGYAMHGEEIG